MKSNEGKCCELSLKELDLSVRLTKHIREFEYDEFWCINRHTCEDLTNLLEVLEAARKQLKSQSDMARLTFEINQYFTLTSALHYTCNFDDFFTNVFDEAEYYDIWELHEMIWKLNEWPAGI